MNAKDINQTFDLLALAQGDTKLKHAGKYYIGACPFCGGTDRFNLTQKPDGWRWLCRHCTDTKYKTPIDYVMQRDDVDFKQALANMGGNSPAPHPHREITEPAKPEIVLPDSNWQGQRLNEISAANNALLPFKPARDYLTFRRIDPCMWNVYLLGFVMAFDPQTQRKRPAISIPWMDEEETITAIKYRFIDELAKDKRYRYTMAKGSKQILFGLQIAGGHETLFLVEGEFNAASIAQQVTALEGYSVDALSFGSETTSHERILQAVACEYRQVIVWADDPEHSSKICASLGRPADAICSPEIDGLKYDANTLLQNGYLAQFLREMIKRPVLDKCAKI
jgi:hypothetical protein